MIIPDHWFIRGAQSALFYYISCGPFSSFNARRRHRREARKDRKKRQAWAAARPDLYTHPAPREINPYWREEMERGQKAAPPPMAEPAPALVRGARGGGGFGSNRRYRRPDEELEWEDDGDEAAAAMSAAVTVAGLETAAAGGREYRAPAVNDQHPAIVSTVPQRAGDRRWMTLEPPSTAFLNGRKGVTVVAARSASAATTASARTSPTLNCSSSVPSLPAPALVVTGGGASPPRSPPTAARGAAPLHQPLSSRSASPGSPGSRPDSATSNSRRRSRGASHKLLCPPRLHLGHAFADGEDEHADDEDDSDDEDARHSAAALRKHSPRLHSYAAGRHGSGSSASILGTATTASEHFHDDHVDFFALDGDDDDDSEDEERRHARPASAAARHARLRARAPKPVSAVQRTRSAANPSAASTAAKRVGAAAAGQGAAAAAASRRPRRASPGSDTGSAAAAAASSPSPSSGDEGTAESLVGRARRRRRQHHHRRRRGTEESHEGEEGDDDDYDEWWGEREVARWAGMSEKLARERLWLGEPRARGARVVGAGASVGGDRRRWSAEC
jgi:hypothetical protein